MKEWGSKIALGMCAAFLIAGCGGGTSVTEEVAPADTTDQIEETQQAPVVDEPQSTLSQELKDSITFMFDEERLAHDVYLAIYEVQPARQLYNVAVNSETQHIDAVDELAVKYDLNVTVYPDTQEPYDAPRVPGVYSVDHVQELYNMLYEKGIQSKRDALEVGCIVEVTDINDLNGYIAQAQDANATDIQEVFTFLKTGSYNHYWAFDKGLKDMGIAEGCCSLGMIDGVEYCHPEYP